MKRDPREVFDEGDWGFVFIFFFIVLAIIGAISAVIWAIVHFLF